MSAGRKPEVSRQRRMSRGASLPREPQITPGAPRVHSIADTQTSQTAGVSLGNDKRLSTPALVTTSCDRRRAFGLTEGLGSDWTGDRSRWYCALQTDSGPTYGALDPAAPPGTAPVTQCVDLRPDEPVRSKSSLRASRTSYSN